MTQNNTKIKGAFYPLQHEEWLRACRELTPSQRDLLYYLRTLDPYSNGIEINCAEIARQLSSDQRQVHRQTISRALKELEAKGFINTEILVAQVTISPKGIWCGETPGCDEIPQGVSGHHSGSSDTERDRYTPTGV